MNFVVLMTFIYSILSSLGLGGFDVGFLIVLVIIGVIIVVLIRLFLSADSCNSCCHCSVFLDRRRPFLDRHSFPCCCRAVNIF